MDRRSFINLLKTATVAAPVAAVTSRFAERAPQSTRAAKDAAERIFDTRKITCGYIPYAPAIIKDPNTGQLSGMFYDLSNKIADLAELEMAWTVETTFATLTEDMKSGKYDLHGGGLWPDTKRAATVDFSMPAFYSGLGVYVRGNDHRFDGNTDKLNNPRYRLAAIDGEMSQIVQQSDFPKASVLGLPDNTDISLLAENVADGKADATIIEKVVANLFLVKNPGALRNLCDAKPIRFFENSWAFAYQMPRLKGVIDTAVKEMLYSGFVDKVLAKYEQVPGSFYRDRPPI